MWLKISTGFFFSIVCGVLGFIIDKKDLPTLREELLKTAERSIIYSSQEDTGKSLSVLRWTTEQRRRGTYVQWTAPQP